MLTGPCLAWVAKTANELRICSVFFGWWSRSGQRVSSSSCSSAGLGGLRNEYLSYSMYASGRGAVEEQKNMGFWRYGLRLDFIDEVVLEGGCEKAVSGGVSISSSREKK